MEKVISIGTRLREIRSFYSETQEEFSSRIGAKRGVLSKYERGDLGLPDDIKANLADLGISLDWLIAGKGSMFLSPPTQGQRIAHARSAAGHDKQGMANLLGVDTDLLEEWENNLKTPDRYILHKIEKITGYSTQWLENGESEIGKLADFERTFPDVRNIYNQWIDLKKRLDNMRELEGIYYRLNDIPRERLMAYAKALIDSQQDQ